MFSSQKNELIGIQKSTSARLIAVTPLLRNDENQLITLNWFKEKKTIRASNGLVFTKSMHNETFAKPINNVR